LHSTLSIYSMKWLKRLVGFLLILLIQNSVILAVEDNQSTIVTNGRYESKSHPKEYIVIKNSKIYFHVSFKGWSDRPIRFESAEYDFELKTNGELYIYTLRSASPILEYDWVLDTAKNSIIQKDITNDKVVTIWLKRPPSKGAP
jgi:hypothetical protein